MNTIKQYMPNFFSGFELEVVNFNTLEELMEIEFVKKFSENEDFYRFSKSEDKLMAEFNEGRRWLVVGFIDDMDSIDLPKWTPID